jgi:hypothetical protein
VALPLANELVVTGKPRYTAYYLDRLPHHQLEPGVRSEHARQIRKHLLPFFGR